MGADRKGWSITDFSGRTVVVTGAAGTLGQAVARRFGARGARLALIGRSPGKLAAIFGEANAQTVLVDIDLRDRAATGRAVAAIAERLGGPHIVCAVAGGFHMGEPVHATSNDVWRTMIDLNVTTLLNTVHAAVPFMLRAGSGKIVTVAAGAARQGLAQMGAYCAAKSAVVRLTESMALELRGNGINVNCVLPGIIDTPQNRAAMPKADPARWVKPDEIADLVAFLASPRAAAIHGAAIPITGLS